MLGEAPPGAALVLAGLDIAAAAWQFTCIAIGVAHPVGHASEDTADPASYSWTGPFHLIGSALYVGALLLSVLLIISVASLIHGTARSQRRTFRVLLGATIMLALVPVAWCALGTLVFKG